MASLSRSAVIQASPARVFAYMTEPLMLPEWLPSMVEVQDVVGSGAGQQYAWTYKMAGMLLRGRSKVIEYLPNQSAVHQSSGTINSTWTLTVEPRPQGSLFTAEVEYVVPVRVLGRVAERIALNRDARDLDLAFDNVRETLERMS